MHNLTKSIGVAVAVCLVLLVVAPARATLIAYDGFDYTTNTTLHGKNGGTGWGSTWRLRSGHGATITAGSLPYADPLFGSDGNQTRVYGDWPQAARDLSSPIGADGTTVWLSFVAKPTVSGNWFAFGLAGATSGNWFTGAYTIGYVGGKWGIGSVASSVNIDTTQPTLVVARIDFAAGNDTVQLFINPSLTNTPTVANATDSSVNINGGSPFTQILLGGWYWGTDGVYYDEVRLGTTFFDALNVVPEPSTVLLLVLGGGLIARAARRRR